MNFNGKFWHKPGHLGMTTAQVKKALQALPTPEAGDAGKAVVVNADADGYELGEAGGGKLYNHTIKWSRYGEIVETSFISANSAPYTASTLHDYAGTYSKYIPITGKVITALMSASGNSFGIKFVYGIKAHTSGNFKMLMISPGFKATESSGAITFTKNAGDDEILYEASHFVDDTVTEL